MSFLLDTCTAIWFGEASDLSAGARATIVRALDADDLRVSPITAWELGLLTSRGRLRLALNVEDWFARLLAYQGLSLAPLEPAVLVASSFLPGEPPNDPADRIIAATARAHGFTVLTRDRKLLAYAQAGHMRALAC